MKQFYSLLEGLLYVAAIVGLLLAFTGCAGTQQVTYTVPRTRADSLVAAAGLTPLTARKVVFRGPFIVQTGGGNTAVAGKNKPGQRAQAVSTGAGSPVVASRPARGVPWYVYAGGAGLLLTGGFWLRGRLKVPWPL